MKKTKGFILLICLMISSIVFCQTKVLENVIDVELRNSVAIVNNKQIVGYALFYKIEKMKKSALFRLAILDENLKEIGSNEFEGPKDLLLRRAVYESDRLFFSFFDEDKKEGYEQFVKTFDLKGKEKGLVAYEPERVKRGFIGAAIARQVSAEMEDMYRGYENIEGKGYVAVYQSKAKTGGVDVQMIGLNGKLVWEQNYTAEKGERTDMYLIGTTANAILLCQVERGGISAKDADIFIVGLSTTNGKEIYKKPLDINGSTYEPMLFKKEEGKLFMVSLISDEKDKFYTAKSIGFNISNFNDLTGEITTIKNFNYKDDLGDVLTMKSGSKSEEGYMKIHDLLFMADGGVAVAGEFFRKTVSALGVAGKILSRNSSGTAAQATVDDMFLLRLDNKYKPLAIEKIEKDKDRWPVPENLPIGLMARYLTSIGMFGYLYTDEGMDGNQKTIVASGSFGDDKYGTVAITIDSKKGFTTKRFDLPKEKKVSYRVYRGKPGYVMISKYNSKEKTITLNLEKTN